MLKKILGICLLFIICAGTVLFSGQFYYDVAYGMSKRKVKKTLPEWVVFKKDKGDTVIYKKKNDHGKVIAEVHFFFEDEKLTSVKEYYIERNANYDVYLFFKESNLKNGELVIEKIKEDASKPIREASINERDNGTLVEDRGFARHIETTIHQRARNRELLLILDEMEPYFTIISTKI
jgi:hypothetical protein